MTVSAQETIFHHVGNGVTTVFAYGCQVLLPNDLYIYVDDIEITSGITKNGIGSLTGGTVTFATAPANGAQIILEREVALERSTDYQQNGDFLARVVNSDFNRIWMALQQVMSGFNRVLRFPKSDIGPDTELPSAASRANRLLSFDASGNPSTVAPDAQSATALSILLQSVGTTLIGGIQAGVGAVLRTLHDRGQDQISVFDFMTAAQIADARTNASAQDHTAAINAAFGSAVFNKKRVFIPGGCTLRITAPIVIPCGLSFVGGGANSKILADYSAWVGVDYRAIVVVSREGINYSGAEYGQEIGNFSLFGTGNAGLVSIGMDFSAAAVIAPAVAVNYSLYNANVHHILVSNFDTAYNIKECWTTTFDNVYSMYCRAGILIAGKSVNLTFSEVRLTNFTNANTSSVAATQGIDVRSGFHYTAGAEGRPEGIVFTPGCLIFGASTNLYVSQCLYFRITDCVIDGATNYGVRIGTADNVKLQGNYIYASAIGGKGVSLDSVGTSDSKVVIEGNHFVGSNAASQVGVDVGNGTRRGVTIANNFFRSWNRPIFLNNVSDSEVTGNYGRSNLSELVYVQSGGANTVIDRNASDDAFAILLCHPTTSALLDIRANVSPTTKTFARGKVTLLSGTTSISIPSGLHSGVERYLRARTQCKVSANIGNWWVSDPVSTSSTATLTCSVAPGADVTIYYEAQAIPSTAL